MNSDLTATLLGTGTPNPNPDRAGASYLFRAGGFRFMIDCGPGALLRLGQAGAGAAEIDHLFFTHFHLDHWADFGSFITNRWIRGNHRPLNVFGPAGLQELVDGLMALHRQDLEYRRATRIEPSGMPEIIVTEIEQGFVFEHSGLTVAPFDVTHFPVEQPLGFVVEASGRKIVFSGDTCPDDNLIRHARSSDVLIHECVEYDKWLSPALDPQLKPRTHTHPRELGRIAAEACPAQCVTTHMLSVSKPKDLHAQIREGLGGALLIGQDLVTV